MDIAFIVCSLLLFAFSVYIGFLIGNTVGVRAVTRADYWEDERRCHCHCRAAFVHLGAVPLFYSVDVGLLAGAIVGLKMAFGESVGPWAVHDKAFNVNRSHRETAEKGCGEERRRRRASREDQHPILSRWKRSPARPVRANRNER